MINLMFFAMTLFVLVAFIPIFKNILEISQGSDYLNCPGYTNVANSVLSYNSTLPSYNLACLAIQLYLPYIVVVILIGGVAKILYDRAVSPVGPGY